MPVVTISVRRSFCQMSGVLVGALIAIGPPQFAAAARIEGRERRPFLVVVHDVQPAVVQGRGGGGAPAHP